MSHDTVKQACPGMCIYTIHAYFNIIKVFYCIILVWLKAKLTSYNSIKFMYSNAKFIKI